MATHSSILAWKIHGWRSLVDYIPWGRKESDTTERLFTFIGSREMVLMNLFAEQQWRHRHREQT